MDLPQSLINILNRRKDHNTILAASKSNYKCSKCKDTGFIENNGAYLRCECYERDILNKLWKNFGVNPEDIKPLDSYKPYNTITKKAKDTAQRYITNFDISSNKKWLCLMGQPGSGKTHIVLSAGKALLENKNKVVYMPYLEAIRELKANSMNDSYDKLISRYKDAEVLIMDDLFKDKVKKGMLVGELTEVDMKHIYPVINVRYSNKMPTLISTECTPQILMELDEALAGRILEMCGKEYGIVFGKDCNYRLREFCN